MRDDTVFAVLRELWTPNGATRREIESSLNLSRPTVDKALAELIGRGLVAPVGTRAYRGGRPATVFRVNANVCSVVGVDLELPQLDCVLADLWGNPLHRLTLSVAVGSDDPIALLREVGETIAGWLESLAATCPRVGGVGVAVPAFVTDGVASFAGATMPTWRGVAIAGVLEREIPAPIHVHHDTHLMALAEARACHLDGEVLLYLALRPGLSGEVRFGASLLVGGRPYRGGHGHGGSLFRAFVGKEELDGRTPEDRVVLLVDRAVGFLVHAVTLLDPERIVIHGGLLGDEEEAFVAGCRRRLRETLGGEFPALQEVARAVERGPAAALGAVLSVVEHLRDNPQPLFAHQGGESRSRVAGQTVYKAEPRSKGGDTS